MLSIHRMLLSFGKGSNHHQHPVNKSPPPPHQQNFSFPLSPLLTAIWKTLHAASFSLRFNPDINLIGCGLLALSRLEYLQMAILVLIFCNVRYFSLTKRGNGISSGIEERVCGNSKCQLKKKWNFLGFWFFYLKISKEWHTILESFQWWKLACSGISKGKVANLKIPVFFRKRYPQPPSPIGYFLK